MAPTTATKAMDAASNYDARECPGCKEDVQMYVPPDRHVAGPIAYPALLLHYESRHPRLTPPPPPMHEEWDLDPITNRRSGQPRMVADNWETAPPQPDQWRPKDENAYRKHLPQPAGVWPPVRDVSAVQET